MDDRLARAGGRPDHAGRRTSGASWPAAWLATVTFGCGVGATGTLVGNDVAWPVPFVWAAVAIVDWIYSRRA